MKIKHILIQSLIIGVLFVSSALTEAVNEKTPATACVLNVTFSGSDFYGLTDDQGVAYPATQWARPGDDCDVVPVNRSFAYKMGTKPKISARIKCPGLADGAMLEISATGSDQINLPKKMVVIKNEIAEYSATADKAWPSETQFYDRSDTSDAFTLTWKVMVEGQDQTIGKTTHQVYVLLDTPTTTRREETLFYMACNNGTEGHTNAGHILTAAIFKNSFATLNILPINPVTGDPHGMALTFTSGANLLKNGTGACGEWGTTFVDVLKVHGMVGRTHSMEARMSGFTRFSIPSSAKNFGGRFHPKTQVREGNTFVNRGGASGGQGDAHTVTFWSGHCVNTAYGFFYDPSYGVGPSKDAGTFEMDGLSGYSVNYSFVNMFGLNDTKEEAQITTGVQQLTYTP